jgi:hypothetical protein
VNASRIILVSGCPLVAIASNQPLPSKVLAGVAAATC